MCALEGVYIWVVIPSPLEGSVYGGKNTRVGDDIFDIFLRCRIHSWWGGRYVCMWKMICSPKLTVFLALFMLLHVCYCMCL